MTPVAARSGKVRAEAVCKNTLQPPALLEPVPAPMLLTTRDHYVVGVRGLRNDTTPGGKGGSGGVPRYLAASIATSPSR